MTFPQRYYLVNFLYILSVSFTKTTFYLYLSECHKIPREDILFIFAVFNLAVMVLEVPTSAIGEAIGPRKSFLIGMGIKLSAASLFLFGRHFWQFCAAEIISALAVTFVSGSLNAWLMSRLSEESSKPCDSPSIFIVGKRINVIALAFGGLAGAISGEFHLGIPWAMVVLGSFFTLVVASFVLTESGPSGTWKKKEKVYRKWQWDTFLYGYKISLSNKILLVLLFNGFLISFALSSPKIFWLPFLKSHFNKDMWFLGYMWVGIMGIQFVGTFGIDSLIRSAGSVLRLKLLLTVFSVLMLLGLALFKHIDSILPFVGFYFLLEWLKPYHHALILSLVHQETKDIEGGRVTILSIGNLMENFGNAIGLLFAASVCKFQSLTFAWTMSTLLYALIVPCYVYLVAREKISWPAQKIEEGSLPA
mgnify:CR=1 FL=1